MSISIKPIGEIGKVFGDNIAIELIDDTIQRLFYKAFDGWCPVCLSNKVNAGETICCECLERAIAYHTNTCGCIK